jgi:hypothetical protein
LVGREGIGTESNLAEHVSTANILDHFPKQLVIVGQFTVFDFFTNEVAQYATKILMSWKGHE